ncbi:3-carboxy-cis,cis-mucoante lactonizing enzyme [Dendrothele bispora CBS 962.96]|uniref:3-carboxy-cis,cis-mucoante lactonizing enzyme n=1 Tax=Dendrothele bispora (strain CBS 962.96) TaxID=1314807 RepID=A0A4S8KKI1_DENBC|nr:3-carboxy-cis,cis-mucoante lactonizing enzyme [Dendrothele bispora CBS 962.96]
MPFTILAGSYTNDVYTLLFDPNARSLTLQNSLKVGHHPSWIVVHPEDRSLAFTGLEQADGKILAIKYDQTGNGKIVAEASSGGKDPCHLVVIGEELAIANYSTGSLSILPISHKAPYILSQAPTETTALTGSGPNRERQEASHAHEAHWNEPYKEILVPDLGGDRVYRFTKDSSSNAWKIFGHIDFEAGGGPRHVVVHDGYLYTLLELSSKITKHLYPLPSSSSFPSSSHIKTLPTMSSPPTQPNSMLAAELLIPSTSTSFPTPYLYVSNRNDPSPLRDLISIFSISPGDSLELVAEVRSGLNHLRGMVFGGENDKYLVAGGVNGGGVKVFERVDGGKGLKVVAEMELEGPTGFVWV